MKKKPQIAVILTLYIMNGNNIRDDANITQRSKLKNVGATDTYPTNDVVPIIPSKLKILDPITFPNIMSILFLKALKKGCS